MAKLVFDNIDKTQKVCASIFDDINTAMDEGNYDVAKVLVQQLQHLTDTTESWHEMLRARLSPAVPATPYRGSK